MKKVIGYDFDDILEAVGLVRRGSMGRFVAPALGLFVVGAGIGAAVGLMFAPSSGRRLRQEVGDRLDQVRERIKSDANATAQRG
ncbi:MAG TPA: YtxH domain-containing protein [Polyangiaceae bacterium]|nr:YtxH domain-containing protein [Polyangiaceae bacterium]